MEGADKVKAKVVPEEKKVSATQDLKETVKSRLAAQNGEVREAVVKKMVDEEKGKRVSLLERAFDDLGKLEGELKKIQPDVVDAEGGRGFYTPNLLKSRNDLADKIAKLEKALDKAVNEKDWSSLKEIVGGTKGGDPRPGSVTTV